MTSVPTRSGPHRSIMVPEVLEMDAKPGDRIVVESERVGKPPQEGEIVEVIVTPVSTGFRVRWDDGHESTFRPAAGSARIVPRADAART